MLEPAEKLVSPVFSPIFPANCGLHSGRSSRSWSFGTKDAYDMAASEQKHCDLKECRPKSLGVDLLPWSFVDQKVRKKKHEKHMTDRFVHLSDLLLVVSFFFWVRSIYEPLFWIRESSANREVEVQQDIRF